MTQPVKIISGFHSCTPSTPRLAIDAGLSSRAAFSIESYRPGSVDMFFDSDLFMSLLNAVSSSVPHDSTEVWQEIPGGIFQRLLRHEHYRIIGSLETLEGMFRQKEPEPPSKIVWTKATKPVVIGVPEGWHLLGGPDPYHDTYTFSLYSSSSDSARIIEALRSTAVRAGSACEFIQAKSSR